MARIRSLKPDFFLDEHLGELSIAHRYVFSGLWCQADREGRLKYEPKKLKVQIIPYDDIDIEKIFTDLAKKPFIKIYMVNSVKYIQIVKWEDHQNPHHTEKPSLLPEIQNNGVLTVKERLVNSENATHSHDQYTMNNKPISQKNEYKDFEDNVLTLWNEFCDKHPSLSKIKKVSGTRRKHLKERFEDKDFRGFQEILKAVEEQPFLIKGNQNSEKHKDWRINIDWLINNDTNYIKVLERKYANGSGHGIDKFLS